MRHRREASEQAMCEENGSWMDGAPKSMWNENDLTHSTNEYPIRNMPGRKHEKQRILGIPA